MEPYYQGFDRQYILPNKERGERVLLFQKIFLGASAINVTVAFSLYVTADSGGINNHTRELIQAVNAIGQGIAGTTFFILFLGWLYRSYSNLHTAGITQVKYAKIWAVVSWFIPILNLFRPYIIMKEIWYWNQGKYRDPNYIPESHAPLRYWWISIFAPVPIAMFFGIITMHDNSLSTYFAMGLVSSLFGFLSTYLFYRFVKKATELEEEFATRFAINQKESLTQLADQYRNEAQLSESSISSPIYDAANDVLNGSFEETTGISQPLRFSMWTTIPCYFILAASDFMPNAIVEIAFWAAVLGTIASVAFFIFWLNEAYKNLRVLRIEKLSVGENLSATWWLIPLVNFYLPYIMLRDLRQHLQTWRNNDESINPLPVLDWSWMLIILSLLFIWVASMLGGSEFASDTDLSLMIILQRCASLAIGLAFVSGIYCLTKFRDWESDLFERVASYVKDVQPGRYQTEIK